MSGAEMAGALDRLRRRLRIDELERAAHPDQAISNVFVPTDGTVLFEDAVGMARRVPVPDWISFMASRMYRVAKEEENRAFNEKSVPDQEANRPLEDGLRRDLRLDALHALAFQPDEMFEAAKEYAVGRRPVAAPAEALPLPDVTKVGLSELEALHDAADVLTSICHALSCQPRCWTEEHGCTPAGEFVEHVLSLVSGVMTACEKEAEQRKPADSSEMDYRLGIIAQAVIENGDAAQTAAFARDLQAAVA